jgi:hypothetical protein
MAQTVTQCLTSAMDSVNLINSNYFRICTCR